MIDRSDPPDSDPDATGQFDPSASGADVIDRSDPPASDPDAIGQFHPLLAEVSSHTGRFGHREHVHLTWLAVRRYGMPAAIEVVSGGLLRTARYSGAPQKYHATMSRAWVELVAHHVAHDPAAQDFVAFARANPALLDKRLLSRFYRSSTLAAPTARATWVEPDRAPFPWQDMRS